MVAFESFDGVLEAVVSVVEATLVVFAEEVFEELFVGVVFDELFSD